MLPVQLRAEAFNAYPVEARKLAIENVGLLQDLPLAFTPFLLREIISYDWKFPVERKELEGQLSYLRALWPNQRKHQMERFAQLQLDPKLQEFDWVNSPAQFLEQLSAHLWATHQTDEFREASEEYVHRLYTSVPKPPLAQPRLGIVVVGQGVTVNQYALFRKLRRSGVYFDKVNPENGVNAILEVLKQRANAQPEAYGHWYIDGGTPAGKMNGITCISYDDLAAVRGALAEKMLAAYEAPKFDPELLRTTLAQMTPENVGLAGHSTLDRFQLTLLTEGSGTQIYSTTFVQWAAREALRRAQPLTLFARYAPRQRERAMNELLSGGTRRNVSADPEGSLIDADMGAYYTWLNQQRLAEAEKARFLVWFEGHSEALAIAPGLARATEDHSVIGMSELLRKVTS